MFYRKNCQRLIFVFFEDRSIGQLCNWRRFGCQHLIAFAVAGQDSLPGLVDNYLIRVLGGGLGSLKVFNPGYDPSPGDLYEGFDPSLGAFYEGSDPSPSDLDQGSDLSPNDLYQGFDPSPSDLYQGFDPSPIDLY